MTKKWPVSVGLIAMTTVVGGLLSSATAYGKSHTEWDGGYGDTLIRDTVVVSEKPAQADALGVASEPRTPSEIDTLTRALALDDAGRSVVNAVWSEDRTSLTIYASGDPRAVQDLVDKSGATDLASVVQSRYSPQQLEAAKKSLFSNAAVLPTGARLFAVMPAVDGSGLVATYEEGIGGQERRSAPPDLQRSSGGVPVQVEFGPAPQAASRASDTAPYKAGAFMRKSNGGCTTAFKIGNISTGTASLISAHHCSPSIGVSWHQGFTPPRR